MKYKLKTLILQMLHPRQFIAGTEDTLVNMAYLMN